MAVACGGSSFEIPEPVGGGDTEMWRRRGARKTESDTPDDPVEPIDPDGPVAEGLPDWPLIAQGAGTLVADGADAQTYSLITAQGYNQEAPDMSGAHAAAPFGISASRSILN